MPVRPEHGVQRSALLLFHQMEASAKGPVVAYGTPELLMLVLAEVALIGPGLPLGFHDKSLALNGTFAPVPW